MEEACRIPGVGRPDSVGMLLSSTGWKRRTEGLLRFQAHGRIAERGVFWKDSFSKFPPLHSDNQPLVSAGENVSLCGRQKSSVRTQPPICLGREMKRERAEEQTEDSRTD